jgi:xanthine dehydrogenase accessory factor
MLVAPIEVLGTIGGGHLEWQAIRLRALLAQGGSASSAFALGPSLGQCCGGACACTYTPLAAGRPAPPGKPDRRRAST